MKNRLTTAKLGWQPRLYNPHLYKWLHRISVPTLILWGDDDKIIPPGYGPAFRDLIPGSRLEVFANCGHVPHVENTDEWVAKVDRLHGGSRVMKFYCFHLMPYAALDPDYDKQLQLRLGDAAEQLLRSEDRPRALQPLSRRARIRRRAAASTASASTSITRTPTG